MSLEIRFARFYCTTSECEFGPTCASDAEAAQLANHVQRTRGVDIRALDLAVRDKALEELRDGSAATMETHCTMACLCGSGKQWSSKLCRLNRPDVSICEACAVPESGQRYSCGCGANCAIERVDIAGFERRLMTGAIVWCCSSCARHYPPLAIQPPSPQVVDLFAALKSALGKGQASTL